METQQRRGGLVPLSPSHTPRSSDKQARDLRFSDSNSSNHKHDKDKGVNVQVLVRCRSLSQTHSELSLVQFIHWVRLRLGNNLTHYQFIIAFRFRFRVFLGHWAKMKRGCIRRSWFRVTRIERKFQLYRVSLTSRSIKTSHLIRFCEFCFSYIIILSYFLKFIMNL